MVDRKVLILSHHARNQDPRLVLTSDTFLILRELAVFSMSVFCHTTHLCLLVRKPDLILPFCVSRLFFF